MATTIDSRDDIHQQLMYEFFESCEDQLDSLSDNFDLLFKEEQGEEDPLAAIRRAAHNLKGLGATFGYPLVSIIAHRLEDFLGHNAALTAHEIQDALVFVEEIRNVLTRKEQPNEEEAAEIVRTLPIRVTQSAAPSKEDDQAQQSLEVLVIMPKSVQQKVLTEELKKNSFRITHIDSSIKAIEMAITAKPDMIMAAAVIDQIEGCEIANIFQSIRATRDIPFVLITSFTEDEEKETLTGLPKTAKIIHKGPDFIKELNEHIEDLDFS